MKYLILQARRPQDGTPPLEALILLPKWMSSTLVCAGITGRITEMSDGNIVEEGNLCWTEEALRHDAKGAVVKTLGDVPKVVLPHPPSTDAPLLRAKDYKPAGELDPDNAYREGMQATRKSVTEAFIKLGMPEDASPLQWVTKQLEERDAHALTIGRLEKSVAALTQEVANLADRPTRQQYDELKAHALDVAGTLERLQGGSKPAPAGKHQEPVPQRDHADDKRLLQEEIDRLLRILGGIRRMAKKGNK